MTFKKSISSTFLALTLIALSGCNSDVEDVNSKSTNSTFEFEKIEVVSTETYASDSKWPDLKDRMSVSLRTCFKDTIYQENIVGEDFSISSDLTDTKKTTSTTGCISWTEELEFNFLSDETFYKVKGEIQGISNYKGMMKYSVAINPWNEKVVDLKHGNVSRVKSITNAATIFADDKYLEAEDIKVTIVEKEFSINETKLNMAVALTPVVIRNGLESGIIKSKLRAGSFNVNYFLIAKNIADDSRKILAQDSVTGNLKRDGILKTNVKFVLKEGVEANTKIELGISLSANRAVSLGTDEGTLNIPKLSGTFSGELIDTNLTFSTIKLLQKNSRLFSDQDGFGFVIDTIEVRNGSEGGANLSSSSTEREVDAIFDIKVVDSLIREDIKYQFFKVELINVENDYVVHEITKRTLNSKGNIQFRTSIPFKSYEKREWKEYKVRITGVAAPFKNVIKERIIHINPWIKTSDFGIDSKLGVPPKVSAENTPEIHIKQFDYWFLGNAEDSFKLNKHLDMTFKRTIAIELEPKLKMAHDVTGNSNGYEKIVNGKYRVRLLILAPKQASGADYTKIVKLNHYATLTAAEAIVDAEDGFINTKLELPLKFADLKYLALKNIALIEVSPVDKETQLRLGYFVGTMIGTKKDGTVGSMQGSGKRLSTGNSNIANDLISRINSVKYKLQKDRSLGDSFNMFKEELSDIDLMVPTYNEKEFKVEKKKVTMDMFKTESSFRRQLNLKLSTKEITQLIEQPTNLSVNMVNGICHLLFNKYVTSTQIYINPYREFSKPTKQVQKGMMFKKCVKNPNAYIDVKSLAHVEKILEQPTSVSVETRDLVRSVAYFVSQGKIFNQMKGTRNSTFTGVGVRASLGSELFLKSGPLAILGGLIPAMEAGKRWESFTMDSLSNTISDQKRMINQDGIKMDYDRFDVSFKAEIKQCLLIGGKVVNDKIPSKFTGVIFESTDAHVYTSNKRYYVCMRNSKKIKKVEPWYFLKVNKISEMSDESLLKNTSITIVRGESNFQKIREDQIETDKDVVFLKIDNDDVIKKYETYYRNRGKDIKANDRIGVGFPGLLE
jgi:hypothetical protein